MAVVKWCHAFVFYFWYVPLFEKVPLKRNERLPRAVLKRKRREEYMTLSAAKASVFLLLQVSRGRITPNRIGFRLSPIISLHATILAKFVLDSQAWRRSGRSVCHSPYYSTSL